MKKLALYFIVLISLILFLVSCASKEELVYFQNVSGFEVNNNLLNYEPEIQKGDELLIHVSAPNIESASPFNLYEASNVNSISRPITYIVNPMGEINFPVIGKIKVEGESTTEISKKLEETLAVYINKPIVNTRLINFKITVLGEVNEPGTYPVTSEGISIIEAIGMAGDLTIQGERKSVLLIRENNGKRQFVTIDLTNKKLFNSPFYYLAQHDIIYVEPNKTRLNSSKMGPNSSFILSSISTLISLIAILNIIK